MSAGIGRGTIKDNQRSDSMGIGINVGTKQDYSYLFQGLSSGSLGNLNMRIMAAWAAQAHRPIRKGLVLTILLTRS